MIYIHNHIHHNIFELLDIGTGRQGDADIRIDLSIHTVGESRRHLLDHTGEVVLDSAGADTDRSLLGDCQENIVNCVELHHVGSEAPGLQCASLQISVLVLAGFGPSNHIRNDTCGFSLQFSHVGLRPFQGKGLN